MIEEMVFSKLTFSNSIELVEWIEERLPPWADSDWYDGISRFKGAYVEACEAYENNAPEKEYECCRDNLIGSFKQLTEAYVSSGLYDRGHAENAIQFIRKIHGMNVVKEKFKVIKGGKYEARSRQNDRELV